MIGGGEINFARFDVDAAEMNVIGSGDIRIGEVLSLEVNIIGSGDIFYGGEPELDSNVLGSGGLNRRQ